MKIEQLSIDGFGQFFNREFGPFDTPLTVIAGPNEAGKSTLVAFIINVLFGFQQKDDALHIPALAGGKHGGRLSIIDDAGNRYVIQRHAGPGRSQGHIVVTREDASPAEDGVLTRLLSAATPDLFRSAFAFDLEQLQSLRPQIIPTFRRLSTARGWASRISVKPLRSSTTAWRRYSNLVPAAKCKILRRFAATWKLSTNSS